METQVILTRKAGEKLHIDGPCTVTFYEIAGKRAKVGVRAERTVKVVRDDAKRKDGA